MVNSENFSDRLQMLFDYYELTAGAFADEIEVGRPSVSHILSGRNKPSLDFVMKVVKRFNEVDLYWLLNGKGSFPSTSNTSNPMEATTPSTQQDNENNLAAIAAAKSDEEIDEVETPVENTINSSKKQVSKVIVLYKDGSFEIFDKLHSL